MQVFISYNFIHDEEFVNLLAEELRGHNITPLTINLQVTLGDKIFDQLEQTVKNCDRSLVILSKAYVRSKWLQKELLALFMKERLMKTSYIVPILIEDCEIPSYIDEARICDLRKVTIERGIDQIAELISETRQVFVVMKLGDERLDDVYALVIKPAIEEFGFTAKRIDEVENAEPITGQILNEIRRSALVLADLTGRRPNCYYEAGYAHGLEKEVIFTVKKGEEIEFDLKVHRFIIWNSEKKFREDLRRRLKVIQNRMQISKRG